MCAERVTDSKKCIGRFIENGYYNLKFVEEVVEGVFAAGTDKMRDKPNMTEFLRKKSLGLLTLFFSASNVINCILKGDNSNLQNRLREFMNYSKVSDGVGINFTIHFVAALFSAALHKGVMDLSTFLKCRDGYIDLSRVQSIVDLKKYIEFANKVEGIVVDSIQVCCEILYDSVRTGNFDPKYAIFMNHMLGGCFEVSFLGECKCYLYVLFNVDERSGGIKFTGDMHRVFLFVFSSLLGKGLGFCKGDLPISKYDWECASVSEYKKVFKDRRGMDEDSEYEIPAGSTDNSKLAKQAMQYFCELLSEKIAGISRVLEDKYIDGLKQEGNFADFSGTNTELRDVIASRFRKCAEDIKSGMLDFGMGGSTQLEDPSSHHPYIQKVTGLD